MTDPLSQLIANDVARRVQLAQPQAPYGVWIHGVGWLKNDQGRVFADLHVEVARTAATLWGDGARVMPMDLPEAGGTSALQGLESKFLAHQHLVGEQKIFTRLKRWLRKVLVNSRAN